VIRSSDIGAHPGVEALPPQSVQYVRMKKRLLLSLGALVALVGAVLFAVVPYTVPVRANGTNNVECDAAIVQMFGSPKFAFERASDSPNGEVWSSVKNFKPPCMSVAHYRLGIAAGLLVLAVVLFLLVILDVRRGRPSGDERDDALVRSSA